LPDTLARTPGKAFEHFVAQSHTVRARLDDLACRYYATFASFFRKRTRNAGSQRLNVLLRRDVDTSMTHFKLFYVREIAVNTRI
jgi:hypothetical protein